ncbi:SDR family NAD(P)-dependent oxidoreductase [Tessaracoccus sp. OH4464_COT-324]|uniref:SDR family NAD(P)-dependent oxidoreductase n=1 Tax=Tessaracoccus sp. OH4464_COT-324 TaxID=2491059 RepID=UPI001F170A53|nr:SDR family NAD(P)-dependent oxidoreductase [Tessaracoccus sp. OH4464_COT-324]
MNMLLPQLRGALIERFGLPVIVEPSEDEPTATFTVEDGLPEGLTLPAIIKVAGDGEEQVVRADVLAGALHAIDPRLKEAGWAVRRSGVVAGRVALVTGGAQGFGEEIVRALHASGAWVFIADLNLDGAEKLAAELGQRATPVKVNVADEESVEQMARTVVETTGGLDLVVSNAGIARAGSVLEQSLAEFELSTDVNYVAFFLVTKHLGRILREQHRFAPEWSTDIIQINSKSGLEGSNRNGAYAGSKFGGIGLVQSFALELVDYRIKVNAICPGNFLDGPLWSDPVKGLFVQYWRSGKVPGAQSVEDVRRHYESKVPMRRGTFGADVMKAVYYLVEQEYETGQAVPVTGGQVMLSS